MTPQKEAGVTMDPEVSEPMAKGTSPAATAAAVARGRRYRCIAVGDVVEFEVEDVPTVKAIALAPGSTSYSYTVTAIAAFGASSTASATVRIVGSSGKLGVTRAPAGSHSSRFPAGTTAMMPCDGPPVTRETVYPTASRTGAQLILL